MNQIYAIFLTSLVLFANLNLAVYQSWCHGENIGLSVNSKKFDSHQEKNQKTEFQQDNCCKDVLIKSSGGSVFSLEKILQLTFFQVQGIFPEIYHSIDFQSIEEEETAVQLFSNPPPPQISLYQYYCRYVYYG
ncbi:MAG: hypothetical protein LBT29_02350 [Flavobacteriaceae bacterium]|nr:hypothetical protein [Flavobacteriaceae bacterium]